MLYYDRIGVSEGIDFNKTRESKECDVCHYWYILNKGFKLQPNIRVKYHDFLMMSMNFSDIVILNIKGSYCCCITSRISKNEAMSS